ncbi:hypothetical protein MK280_07690 [Myxococcota bacterium]|nr:hypothetical protein [Myxococcota bacterium]
MKIAAEKNLVRTLFVVLAMASALSPAISGAHGLDHLAEQYAAMGDDGGHTGSIPDGESDVTAPCDLCGVLASGRTAMTAGGLQVWAGIERPDSVVSPSDWLLPRAPQFEPESQRAPPLD